MQEIFYRLFQIRILPRGDLFRITHKILTGNYHSKIIDMKIGKARFRLLPNSNVSSKKLLAKGKFTDRLERKAIADACRSTKQPIFIDVGSNFGLYAILLAQEIPTLKVYAVEPHPLIRKFLIFNVSRNSAKNTQILDCALSDQPRSVRMKTNMSNLGQSKIHDDGDVTNIECKTLEMLVDELNLPHITAIKVDVEGFEDRVLTPYLENADDAMLPLVIVIESNPDQWDRNPIEIAKSRGYRLAAATKMNNILVR